MTLKNLFHLRSLHKQVRAAQAHGLLVWNMNRDRLVPAEAEALKASVDALAPLRRSRDPDAIQAGLDTCAAVGTASVCFSGRSV